MTLISHDDRPLVTDPEAVQAACAGGLRALAVLGVKPETVPPIITTDPTGLLVWLRAARGDFPRTAQRREERLRVVYAAEGKLRACIPVTEAI